MLPSQIFLADIEHSFAVAFPDVFHSFCRRHATTDVATKYPVLRRGKFITDLTTLEAINAQIGGEEWGDYERILAGKEQRKSGGWLWGGLLPVYFVPNDKRGRQKKLAKDIYGFSADEPGSEKVLVWSVHCVVHSYPTLEAWLTDT